MIEIIADAAHWVSAAAGFVGGYDHACDLCRLAAVDADRDGIAYSAEMLADVVLDAYATFG